MKFKIIKASVFLLVSAVVGLSVSSAATLFWDANGAAGCGGVGNWGSGAVQGNYWGTACDTGLGVWNNANVDSASFGGTGVTVTVTNAVTVNKLIVNSAAYILGGASTVTFSG